MSLERVQHLSPHLPGDLPNPGIEPISLVSPALAGEFFTTGTTWDYIVGIITPLKWSLRKYGRGIAPQDALKKDSRGLLRAEGSGAGGVQTAKASHKQSSFQAKRAPRAAFPSGCLAAQTKRWAEGIRVPAPLAGGGSPVLCHHLVCLDTIASVSRRM